MCVASGEWVSDSCPGCWVYATTSDDQGIRGIAGAAEKRTQQTRADVKDDDSPLPSPLSPLPLPPR